MSKVIKGALIGALIFATGGLALSLMPAAIGSAVGFTTIGAAAISGAIYGGLSGLSASFIKKPSADTTETKNRLFTSVDPQSKFKWVFGETSLPTDIVYSENHGDKKEFASYVFAAAGHEIESYGAVYVNDELVNFLANAATGAWDDTLWKQDLVGVTGQAALPQIDIEDGWSWPSTATGTDIPHWRFRWKLGQDKTSSGVPRRLTRVGKGCKVYDPRLDSTNGGSGSHRVDDQSTWEYSNGGVDIGANWALLVAWYWLGWKIDGKIVIGMGTDPEDIDWNNVAAVANQCDTLRDGIPAYHIGGVFDCDNNHDRILGQLESAVGGKISKFGGLRSLWVPDNDLTIFSSITENDILRQGGVEFTPAAPIETLVNTARGRYISPADLYQLVGYPDVVEASAVSDDGRERMLSHDFSLIQNEVRAQRIARYLVRRSRFTATWKIAMGPKGLLFQPFSVTTLNCQETNFVDQTVRVIGLGYNLSGVVVVELLEEDSSIYDTSSALSSSPPKLNPAAFDPATKVGVSSLTVSSITAVGVSGTASDGLKISWADPKSLVAKTEAQFKISTDSDWISIPDSAVDFLSATAVGVESGTLYDVRTRHVTIFGVPGTWVLAQQIAGSAGSNALAGAGVRGGNLVPNSDFSNFKQNWIEFENASGDTFTFSVNLSNDWRPPGTNVHYIRQVGTNVSATATVYKDNEASGIITVEAGKRYQFHARVGCHRCSAFLQIRWRDSDGNLITTSTLTLENDGNFQGGTELENYKQIGGFATAPAGAALAGILAWKRGTTAGFGFTDSYMFTTRIYFGEASPTQTEFSPWQASPIDLNWTNVYDLLGNRPEDSADVTWRRTNDIQNPNFDAGNTGWTLQGNFSIINDGNALNGLYALYCAGVTDSHSTNQTYPQISGGERLIASVRCRPTLGLMSLLVQFQTAAGAFVGNAWGNVVSTVDGNYYISSIDAVAPAGAERFYIAGRTRGSTPTSGYFDGFKYAIVPSTIVGQGAFALKDTVAEGDLDLGSVTEVYSVQASSATANSVIPTTLLTINIPSKPVAYRLVATFGCDGWQTSWGGGQQSEVGILSSSGPGAGNEAQLSLAKETKFSEYEFDVPASTAITVNARCINATASDLSSFENLSMVCLVFKA